MTRAFADTSFYQALFNKRDAWHQAAAQKFRDVQAKILTTDYVLVELGALMARGEARQIYVQFVERLRSDPDTELVPASNELLDAGLSLFAARPDKNWSLTDCISFALMNNRNIRQALACDRHFEQAGFDLLITK